ncbi:MAG: 1-deoxy-D-xylulose-5-phosphate synthase [Geodermatophilaceae bacterium]
MTLLSSLRDPDDLRALDAAELPQLAAEIRDFLVRKLAVTGGHLGPNLGAVELTIALHRVFDSPGEPIVFDTGHQSYVHKILTGRQTGFDTLRRMGGMSGYPNRAESEHDWVENSHASTALSYADGLAKAFAVRREARPVVAVVGDGALTGGMAWEALNNIAAAKDRQVAIVFNDNCLSYSPTVGGVADRLATLRLRPGYEQVLDVVKDALARTPLVGAPLYDALHGIKRGLKDVVAPQGMFEDLGLKYVGPVDGHDIAALDKALRRARAFGGPVIVHCVTHKGFGYAPAETDSEDHWHSTDAFDPDVGSLLSTKGAGWTDVFAEELVRLGGERSDVVAVTAAMLFPAGLAPFAEHYPDRCFDVGIAEQHAVTSAAGLAMGGMHPVVAIYSTFLNRAFDQLLLDVAMHKLPVTFVLDRAGVTGPDGASHHGMWDLSLLGNVPGMRVAAPRDAARLREQLRVAVAIADGPSAVRFPKGAVGPDVPALTRRDGVDVLRRGERPDVLLVSVGACAGTALEVADRVSGQGIDVTVVDPCWVLPINPALRELAAGYRLVVTVEDAARHGGIGSALSQDLRAHGIDVPVRDVSLPQRFLAHGSRPEVLAEYGLSSQAIARQVIEWASRIVEHTDHPATDSV